jgi:hypothetical protein
MMCKNREIKFTFISANSWNSCKRVYIVNLLERYFSLLKAKLFVGPSEITLRTYSRSTKYSRMSGISNAGVCCESSVETAVSMLVNQRWERFTFFSVINLVDAFII